MTEQFVRWYRIIYAIQAKPGITVKELAVRCETTERTIYRDLRTLDTVAPITNEGYGTGYKFVGDYAIYPFNWTEQEALVFSMLPSVVDTTKLPPGFEGAYDKVMAAHFKQRSRDKEIIQHVTEMIQTGTPAYREETPNYLMPVIQAILQEKTIDVEYHTQSRNELTKRLIDPYFLVPRDQRFYLIGYCHTANDIRTFRISRFRKVELTNRSFEKEQFNVKNYMKNTWSIERGEELIHFKIKFSKEIARYIKEEELFVRPRMTEKKDGSLLFEVTVNHDREFLNWLYQFGADAEILEPKSYRDMMKERLAKWQKIYD